MKKSDGRGQMKLSFGMIFSIFLIVIFIAFAFYAIKMFVGMQKKIQIDKFAEDLQADIDRAWRSTGDISTEEEYILPKKINSVCFKDNEYKNLVFRSSELIDGKKINNIDIERITETENPFCIQNTDGKVKLIIQKDYGENLVTITRQD